MSQISKKVRKVETDINKNKNKKSKTNSTTTTTNENTVKPKTNENTQSITFKVCDTKKEQVESIPFNLIDIIKLNCDNDDHSIPKWQKPSAERVKQIEANKNIKRKELMSSFIKDSNGIVEISRYIGPNSFVNSAIIAFSQHHALSIRPDDIWMAILNQLSIHVNINSEALRDKLVDFQSKKSLEVVTDFPILKAPFDKLALEIASQIELNIKDPSIREWSIPKFTTTTPSDTVVFSVALMSTMKGYFDSRFSTRCGIPEVTLNGSVEDWVSIKNRLDKLSDFAIPNPDRFNIITEWIKMLHKIIDKFIETASGNPDIEFWSKIADKQNRSGGPFVTGWITAFSIYDKLNEPNLKQLSREHDPWCTISYDKIPNGFVSVPVTLKDFDGTIYQSTMYSGHIGVTIEDKNSKIIPSLDWAIVLDNSNKQ